MTAVLLAIELLLFEYRPRSLIPVALASAAACGAHMALVGSGPAFAMPALAAPTGRQRSRVYAAMGIVVGVASVLVTRAVYAVEDAFEKLPIHWMWWPALGGVVVGVVGILSPHTMGVGYDNIDRILSGDLAGQARRRLLRAQVRLVGDLARQRHLGRHARAALHDRRRPRVASSARWPPGRCRRAGVDVRVAALVGMAAIFAGASRALLASVVFAFETTRQPMALLPLLGGCTAAYLVSALVMRHSIMTEKIARRGGRVVSDYAADLLRAGPRLGRRRGARRHSAGARDRARASASGSRSARTDPSTRASRSSTPSDRIVGVVTRRDLFDAGATGTVRDVVKRPPAIVFEDSSLRDAIDHMVREGVGRLPVVSRANPGRVVGIVTRGDLVAGLRAPHRSRAPERTPLPRAAAPCRAADSAAGPRAPAEDEVLTASAADTCETSSTARSRRPMRYAGRHEIGRLESRLRTRRRRRRRQRAVHAARDEQLDAAHRGRRRRGGSRRLPALEEPRA